MSVINVILFLDKHSSVCRSETLHLSSKEKYIPQCLKIVEKISFNIASEASYVNILSGQKLIKNAKISQFGEFSKK